MVMGSGWAGLRRKDTLTGESFAASRNWLTLGGAVPPRSAKPHPIKALEIQNTKKARLIQVVILKPLTK